MLALQTRPAKPKSARDRMGFVQKLAASKESETSLLKNANPQKGSTLSYHAIRTTTVSRQVVATHLHRSEGFPFNRGFQNSVRFICIQRNQSQQIPKTRWIDVGELELQVTDKLHDTSTTATSSYAGAICCTQTSPREQGD